jgi:hypothetical protein
MDNNDGSGGFTRYVTMETFKQHCDTMKADQDRINTALWGSEGTNGLIKDIHDLKMWIRFLGILASIVSPVVTAVIVKFLLG